MITFLAILCLIPFESIPLKAGMCRIRCREIGENTPLFSVHRLAWSRTPGLGPGDAGSNPAARTIFAPARTKAGGILSGLTVGAVTRESSHCGGHDVPFHERQPGASAILGPAFHLPALRLRPASWLDGETLTGRKSFDLSVLPPTFEGDVDASARSFVDAVLLLFAQAKA